MTEPGNSSLKERIRSEMMVDYESALERNYELAKEYVCLTTAGKVEVRAHGRFTARERVQLYLIGKLYASEAEICDSDSAPNDELLEELGLPKGTLMPTLKDLRDKNRIAQIKDGGRVRHRMPKNMVQRSLEEIQAKITNEEGGT